MHTALAASVTAARAAAIKGRGCPPRRDGSALPQRHARVRDALFVLALTGRDTFFGEGSPLREAIAGAHDLSVMLANPAGGGLRRRVATRAWPTPLSSLQEEIGVSVAYLADRRSRGSRVALKFYVQEPFWKVIVLGERVWVQDCHAAPGLRPGPEYEFAGQSAALASSTPFLMHFLDRWNDSRNPEYDFDAGQLVYRDAATGNVVRRAPLGVQLAGWRSPRADQTAIGALIEGCGS